MEIKDMNMEEIEARKAEISAELDGLSAEEVEARTAEVAELETRKAEIVKEVEARKALAEKVKASATVVKDFAEEPKQEERKMENTLETRANQFKETKRFEMEARALLGSDVLGNTIVKQTIGELPTVVSSILDDVNSFDATGASAWSYAYRLTDSAAAEVTDGQTITGTSGTFATGTITPSEWGILDTISNQVAKLSTIDYLSSVQSNAYLALRKYAKGQIVSAVLADAAKSTGKMTSNRAVALDKDFVRNLVLGFDADESVAGDAKLYLCKEDLATIGAIRGTNEKKAVFEITFDDANNGKIVDGGMVVPFSILSDLDGKSKTTSGGNVMIYGKPKAIAMPLFGGYSVTTNDSVYFDKNLLAIRGIQTAGVAITSLDALQTINY